MTTSTPPAMDHRDRRRRLASLVGAGTILFVGHRAAPRDHAADHYPFRQDPSFTYFLGVDEPDTAALVDAATGHTTLFGVEADLDDLLWHGPRPPLEARSAAAAADHHRPLGDLPDAVAGATGPVLTLPSTRPGQSDDLRTLLGPDHRPSRDLVRAVGHLREVKESPEVAEIEQALERTAFIHAAATVATRPGADLGAVVRHLDGVVASTGGTWAYPVIFTTRGEVLHAFGASGTMRRGDLLLHDGGVTSDLGYAADITRTLPVGGRFEPKARHLYETVLAARDAALSAMTVGTPNLDVHKAAGRAILEGCSAAGLFDGDLDAATEAGAYGVVFPHGVGHLLGIEVHDLEGLGEDLVGYDTETRRPEAFGPSNLRYGKRLREGTVITVEPGMYLHGPLIEWFRASGHFRGLWDYDRLAEWVGIGGVRIEDVVLLEAEGPRVLGPAIPRNIADVEAALIG